MVFVHDVNGRGKYKVTGKRKKSRKCARPASRVLDVHKYSTFTQPPVYYEKKITRCESHIRAKK